MFVSLYMDVNSEIEQEFITKILTYSSDNGLPIIIGADTNSHTLITGQDTNRRGLELEELILNHGLLVENIGSKVPTYETVRGDKLIQTWIDVTFSRDLDQQISSWRVDQEYNGSDHNTLLFKLTFSEGNNVAVRNWNDADWSNFTIQITKAKFYEPNIVTEKKLDRCLHQLYKMLDRALDKVCPKKIKKLGVKANLWYNNCLLYTSDAADE